MIISAVEAVIIFLVLTRDDQRGLHDLLFNTKVISTETTENEEETTEEVSEEIIEDDIEDETEEEETLEDENNYPEETTTDVSDDFEESEDDEIDKEDTTLVTIGDDQWFFVRAKKVKT